MSDNKQQIDNVRSNVFMPSEDITIENRKVCRGYDLDNGRDFDALLNTYIHSGFQATAFGEAIEEINKMVGNIFTPLMDGAYFKLD